MKSNKFSKGLNWFLNSYIWIFPLFLALDIFSKNFVVNSLELYEKVDIIPGFLAITYTINDKAAFSIGFTDATINKIIYSVIALIATVTIITIFIKKYKTLDGVVKACLMLVLVGAIGNLIDRLFYSPDYLHSGSSLCGVVDFIDFYGIWGAIFNIADSCVVIAAIILLIYCIVIEVKDSAKQNAKKNNAKKTISKTEEMIENSNKKVNK